MKDNTEDNTSLITQDSSEALDLLVDAVIQADPRVNKPIFDKYKEIKNKGTKKNSRQVNQLNAEDLAKQADNLDTAYDYLLDDKEMEK